MSPTDFLEVVNRARKRRGLRARFHRDAAWTSSSGARTKILNREQQIVRLLSTQYDLIAGTVAARLNLRWRKLAALHGDVARYIDDFDAVHVVVPLLVFGESSSDIIGQNNADARQRLRLFPIRTALPVGIHSVAINPFVLASIVNHAFIACLRD